MTKEQLDNYKQDIEQEFTKLKFAMARLEGAMRLVLDIEKAMTSDSGNAKSQKSIPSVAEILPPTKSTKKEPDAK